MGYKSLFKKLGIFFTLSFATIGAFAIFSSNSDLFKFDATREANSAYTLLLNSSNGQITGAYQTSDTSLKTARTSDGNTVEIMHNNCGIFSEKGIYAQMKKTVGYFYNTDTLDPSNNIYPLTNITSITAVFTGTAPTLYLGTSEKPSTNATTLTSGLTVVTNGNNFFRVAAGSGVCYLTSLSITYNCGGGSGQEIVEPTLNSVTVDDLIGTYQVGHTLNELNGLEVIANYSNGSRQIEEGYTINGIGFDPSEPFVTAGTYSLSVTYQGVTSNTISIDVIGSTPVSNDPTNITLNKSTLALKVGETELLSSVLTPTTATTSITWSSSNPTIASVSAGGLVVALAAGTTNISATTSNGLVAICALTVSNPVSGNSLSYRIQFNTSGTADGSTDLTSATMLAQVTSGSEYISSFASIVKTYTGNGGIKLGSSKAAGSFSINLSAKGQVQAKAIVVAAKKYSTDSTTIAINGLTSQSPSGSTYEDLTFTTLDNTQTLSTINLTTTGKRCYVSYIDVLYGEPEPVEMSGLTLSSSTLAVALNGTANLNVNITPSNIYPAAVISWSSSDASVATVSNGVISGIKEGTARITATAIQDTKVLTAFCDVTVSRVAVTGVSLNKTSTTIGIGSTDTLLANILPANATNKSITWSTTNSAVATVNNGVVTGKALGTANIYAITADGSYTASCSVTVEEISDDYTVMIYMSGNDLESESYLATSDIKEILSVTLPEGVNVIIETGGAKKWSSTYSISASYLTRWHVENKQLVKDEQLTKANMGLSSTFQSFMEWGLTNYPAKQTGVIMWNHGGAMDGVCYDENYSDDPLLTNEVTSAVGNAFSAVGRTDKLDWIGYDACLMAVTDIASKNAQYFDYMFASQELEPGYGWDYDNWLKTIASNPSADPLTVGKSITDTYITDNGGTSSSSNDATFSVMDLSQMGTFTAAWEAMATQLKTIVNSTSKWTTFANLVKQSQQFGYDSSYGYTYDVFDLQDFCDNMEASSTYSGVKSQVEAVEAAYKNVVLYNKYGKANADACGLSFFCAIYGYTSQTAAYGSTQTNFTNWRSLMVSYGSWY
jgi:uncharacterized protein YjdB